MWHDIAKGPPQSEKSGNDGSELEPLVSKAQPERMERTDARAEDVRLVHDDGSRLRKWQSRMARGLDSRPLEAAVSPTDAPLSGF